MRYRPLAFPQELTAEEKRLALEQFRTFVAQPEILEWWRSTGELHRRPFALNELIHDGCTLASEVEGYQLLEGPSSRAARTAIARRFFALFGVDDPLIDVYDAKKFAKIGLHHTTMAALADDRGFVDFVESVRARRGGRMKIVGLFFDKSGIAELSAIYRPPPRLPGSPESNSSQNAPIVEFNPLNDALMLYLQSRSAESGSRVDTALENADLKSSMWRFFARVPFHTLVDRPGWLKSEVLAAESGHIRDDPGEMLLADEMTFSPEFVQAPLTPEFQEATRSQLREIHRESSWINRESAVAMALYSLQKRSKESQRGQ